MVALGRCILRRPRLLLLDEPSLGLAPIIVDRIYEMLTVMRGSGMSILVVEQSIPRVTDFADRLCLIQTGVSRASVGTDDPEGIYLGHPQVELFDAVPWRRPSLAPRTIEGCVRHLMSASAQPCGHAVDK